jgi:hypothetical protein
VPGNAVTPCPKLLCRPAFKSPHAGGNRLQDFLHGVLGGVMRNAAEHEEAQVRLDQADNFLRQPDALGQSRREPVGADQFDEVVHLRA